MFFIFNSVISLTLIQIKKYRFLFVKICPPRVEWCKGHRTWKGKFGVGVQENGSVYF